jgi:hypothetical protein
MPDTNAPAAAPAPASTSPMKALFIVVGVVLLEALTIGATMYLAGGPKQAAAGVLETDRQAQLNRPVEVSVVKDKFLNTQTGRAILYDSEIYIIVRNRDADRVRAALDSIKAQTEMDVATIMRSAQPSYFQEPTLTTLRRQIQAKLEDRLETAMQYHLALPAAPAAGEEGGDAHAAPAAEASTAAPAPAPAASSAENSKESAPGGMDTGKGSLVQDVLITRLIPYRAD